MANTYEDDDDIVTLLSADGEEIDFVEIAGIAYRGGFYAILQPVELLDGMSDDEALVFKVCRGPNGEDKFEIELDDKIIDAVFKEYNRLLDEAERKSGSKSGNSSGKKLKKSSGIGNFFNATKKVANKTIWVVKFVLSILVTLVGVFFTIGALTSIGSDLIMGIFFGVIGIAALVAGVKWLTKNWKHRND